MKNHLLFLLLVLFPVSCFGQQDQASSLRLAAPIADHMVLQHSKPTSVWGTSAPDSSVTVAFAGQTVQAKADANGQWQATLSPLSINADPASLTVTSAGGDKITINDVLVGEVWMCSGQSNMQWTLSRTKDHNEQSKMPLWISKECSDFEPSPPKSIDIIRILLHRIRRVLTGK